MNIKQIAKAAGVSVATVSRVLNHPETVAPATREKIQKIIEEEEYTPNWFAQGLNFNRTKTTGVIVPHMMTPMYMELVSGIEEVARPKGYITFLCNVERDPKMEKEYVEQLMTRKVDGIILMSSALEEKYITMIQKEKIPVVLIGESIAANRFNSVNVDCRASAVEMVAHLVEVGHRTIALLKGHDPHHETEEMSLGYQNVLRANGIPVDRKWIMDVENTIEGGYIGMKRMLAAGAPDAIFCTSDEIAYGAMEALKDSGMSIPEDVAVAGFGNNRMSNLIEPKLTTVELPYRKMGIYGARILFDLIEGETDSRDPRHILLQSRLRIRRSCGHQERIGEMF
ncbi:MAG: LacI family DNA-binding transcriptional regulator [Firmicutes bacterium]|nr:LacI family DNA-binding transcriptional regulator [Bacillota bacterium]